jgi:hypothetical protein
LTRSLEGVVLENWRADKAGKEEVFKALRHERSLDSLAIEWMPRLPALDLGRDAGADGDLRAAR